MLIWFAATAVLTTWAVFQSPAIDYRLVALGAVLPVLEVPFGVGPLHSLLAPTVVLAAVMLATRGRRLVRRQWLGLPIGMYLHLVFDGAFTRAQSFWWPFLGWDLGGGAAFELSRSWWSLLMELVGVGMLLWGFERFGLSDPERRSRFLRTGQLDRSVIGPGGLDDGRSTRS